MRHLYILCALCVAVLVLPVASCFNNNNNPPPPPSLDASFLVDASLHLPDGASLDGFQADSLGPTYTVGVTINGLQGSGLQIQGAATYDAASGMETIQIPAGATSATFPTPVLAGTQYSITVAAQPTQPSQNCTVQGSGTGTIMGTSGNAPIQVAVINCTTNTYTVGGSVTGLLGTRLLLQNGSDLLPVSSDGTFTFPTQVASGGTYLVTIAADPVGISQNCVLASGTDSGTVTDHNVTTISVSCSTNTFTVGGTVSGLSGTGLVLEDNGGSDLTVNTNGSFTFANRVASGALFDVTIKTQPFGPAQTCTVTGSKGTVGTSAVKSVVVNCGTNSFTVGGTVTGLLNTGLQLQNGGATLQISGDGSFAFPPSPSGSPFNVTVLTQPTGQTCNVTGGVGTVMSADVTSVTVTCSSMGPFFVGGSVTGLTTSGLVLTNNGGSNLTIGGNGGFEFPTPLDDGSAYNVAILTQPSGGFCQLTNGAGTIMGGDVNSVVVRCSFTVSVNVGGLSMSGLVLEDNGGDDLSVSTSGTFSFATAVPGGSSYNVTISGQPPSTSCRVTGNGSGTVLGDVTADVTCSQLNTISVTVAFTGCDPVRESFSGSLSDNAYDVSAVAISATDLVTDGGVPTTHTYVVPPLVGAGGNYSLDISGDSNAFQTTCTFDNTDGGTRVSGVMGDAPLTFTATCTCNLG